jgi:hypothetical protein
VDDSAYSLSGRKLQVRVRCGGCFGVGSSFNGDEIADNIIEGVDQCGTPGGANGKSLGVVTFNPGPNLAYTMWLGNICGQLGFGDVGEVRLSVWTAHVCVWIKERYRRSV